MVSSKAKTVAEYLKELPEEKRREISEVRNLALANLPLGFVEGVQYGMISYHIPIKDYPYTYNGLSLGLAGIASQKNYNSLYLNTVYGTQKSRSGSSRVIRPVGKNEIWGNRASILRRPRTCLLTSSQKQLQRYRKMPTLDTSKMYAVLLERSGIKKKTPEFFG